MKIAMLGLKGLPCPGGVETVMEELGSRLAARGHEVLVYVRPHYTPRQLKEYKGMRLINLPSIPTKNLDAITHSFLATISAILERPDVIHINATGNSVYAILPRLFGIPTVVQSHGLDWQRAKWGRIARTFLKMTDYTTTHFPNVTTVVSRQMQQYYQQKFKKPVLYIPNGVKKFQKVKPQKLLDYGLKGNDYIFFAARLVPEKGCHYLIEAYKSLGEVSKKLVIAGDGSYGDAYAEKLKQLAGENIVFTGFVKGPLLQELLSNAYVYVLPSEIEGLSTGLLEAMSYGNCVLVSDIPENLEVIGNNGCAFRNKNIPDLAEKLSLLLTDENLVKRYRSKAAQTTGSQYSWDHVTDQYEILYRTLIGKRLTVGEAEY